MKFEQRGGVKFLKYKNRHNKNIIFRDSVYILPGTLKDLGKSFSDGTYKGITPQKFINPTLIGFDRKEYIKDVKKYNKEHLDELDIEYCKDDCLVLYKILHNEEVLKLKYRNFNTIAKIANTKMLNSIEPIVIFNRFDYEFRNMYSGGLTSVFKHEAFGKIGTYDVNSMYPKSMSQYFGKPENLEEFFYEDKVEEEILEYFEMLQDYPNGKSKVEITLKRNTPKKVVDILKKTPLIPVQKTSYGNIFDGNTYIMEVMNQELSNLLNPLIREYFEIKPIRSIHCRKENLFYPFKDFIEFHYNERLKNKKSKPAYAQILKLIMNSSYGYFAMQQDNSNYIYGSEDSIGFQIEKICYEKGFDIISYEEYKKESRL
jgi:DNA polymerase elongation subunit (family B)